jgi:hypothetical protein
MSEFSIISNDFKDGEEIPKECGYKHGNVQPDIGFGHIPNETKTVALIMDDPDAMGAVGKVWVHWLEYHDVNDITTTISGKTDFGEIGYGGPAPPDKRHTYIFKAYALDVELDLKEGYSKQELEDAMKDHILAEAKLTGTFAP